MRLSPNKNIVRYGKNIFWFLIEKVVRIVLGITIGAWIARHLGPGDFGVLNFANSFVGILSVLSVLGLEDILIREILQDKSKKGIVLGTACVLKILGSCMLFLIVYLTIPFIDDLPRTRAIVLVLSASFFFRSFDVINYYFRGEVLSEYVVFSNIASLIVCSLVRVILIIYDWPLIYFAAVSLIEFALCSLFYGAFYIWKEGFFKDWLFSFSMAKKLLHSSWPLLLTGVIMGIDNRVDQVMLNKMIGVEATGYYAAAVRVNESIFWMLEIFTVTFFPAIVNAKKEHHQKYAFQVEMFYTFMIMAFLVLCLPLIVFSEDIISILYGNQYTISSDILKVNAMCGFFIAMKCTQARWSIVEKLQRYNLIIQISGSICNVLLNFFFIKKLGVMGAAYGTLIAHALGLLTVTWIIKPMKPSLVMMAKGIFNIFSFRFIQWRFLLEKDN